MRSKTFQRILYKMEKDPWWVKLKTLTILEIYVISCIGIAKYIRKNNTVLTTKIKINKNNKH